MSELIDVYDSERTFTGEVLERKSTKLQPHQYMLYTLAIIQNAQGDYLITQRANKSWGNGWWEVSGGGVRSGETTAQAVVREVHEEVGLDVSAFVGEPIYSYRNDDPEGGDNYFMDVYHFAFEFDGEQIVLQPEEASAFKLVSWDEICELAEQGIFLHFERIKTALKK